MKDYEIRDNIEKQIFKLTEKTHTQKCKLEGWDTRFEKATLHYEAQKEEYNGTVVRLQASIDTMKKNILALQKKLVSQKALVIKNAHPGQTRCQYCKRHFKDITRHKCSKIPPEVVAEQAAIVKAEAEQVEFIKAEKARQAEIDAIFEKQEKARIKEEKKKAAIEKRKATIAKKKAEKDARELELKTKREELIALEALSKEEVEEIDLETEEGD